MTKLHLLLAAATLAVITPIQAATYYWDAGTVTVDGISTGGTGAWTIGATGWEDGTSAQNWANGNLAVFGGAASTVTLGGNISATGLRFTNTGAYTITGATTARTLTIGASGIDMSAAAADVNFGANMTIAVGGNSQTWNVATGRTLSLSSVGLNGVLTGTNAATITVAGGGLVDLLPTATGATNYAGNWLVQGGSTLRSTRNQAAAFGAGSITLNGGTLAVGGITGSGAQGNWTFNNAITLGTGGTNYIDNQLPNSGTNRWLKLDGAMSGAGGVTFRNTTAATMNSDEYGFVLAGTNTFTGNMGISSGAFVRIGGQAVGTTNANAGNSGSIASTVAIANDGVLRLTRNDAWTFANSMSGTGQLKIGGTIGTTTGQVVTVSGANTYTGATTVVNGRLNLTGSLTSAITVTGGAISGTGSTTGSLTLNGGVIALAGGATTTSLTTNGVTFAAATALNFLTAPLAGNYDVVTYGAGGVTNFGNLSSAGYRGTLSDDTINQKIVFAAAGVGTRTWNTTSGTWDLFTTANFAEGDQKFAAGDTVIFNEPAAASVITLAGRLNPASVTVNNSTNKITFTGTAGTNDITGSGSLTKTGTGTLAITSAQTYSGGTTLSAGTLQAGDNAAFGTGALALNGGTLSSDSATARALSNTLTLGGDVTLGDAVNNGALTFSGATNLSGATRQITTASSVTLGGVISNGGLTKTGAGTLTLSNSGSNFAGNVVINGGQVTAIGISGNTNTVLGVANGSRTVTVNNTGTLLLSGNNVFGGGSQTLANTIKLVVNAGGTVTTNAYNVIGNVDLNGGTLTATAGSGSTYQTFEFNGSTITVGGTTGSTISSTATSNGGMHIAGGTTLTLNVGATGAGNDLIVSAALINGSGDRPGNGSLTKNGAGTALLTGTNTYSGNTTINGGVLDLTAGKLYSNAYNGAATVTVNTGGTLRLNSFGYSASASLGQLADYGARRVINGGTIEVTAATESAGNNFNVGANGGTFRYKPADSTNTLTLTGNGNSNITVSGALTVETLGHVVIAEVIDGAGSLVKAGDKSLTLSAANTYAGGTTVSAGALVTGSTAALGSGGVAVNGGTLQIGDGTTNTVTLGAGATLAVADGATLKFFAAGSAVALQGAGTYTLGNSTLDLNNLFNAAGTYNLITGGNAAGGTQGTLTFSNFDSVNFSAAFSGGSLVVTAVPEPSTYGLIGAGALAAVAFVRRRRKAAGIAA